MIDNIIFLRILDESLRWLIANGKLDQARKVIHNACKWNNKDYDTVMAAVGFPDENIAAEKTYQRIYKLAKIPDVVKVEKDYQVVNFDDQSHVIPEKETCIPKDHAPKQPVVEKYTAIDIFRHPKILQVSMIIWFTW